MSGPVTPVDAPADPEVTPPEDHPCIEFIPSHDALVGEVRVRRALPQRTRRSVGAWCFVDHMGPAMVTEQRGVDIGPHPHIGLQTVTWVIEGEILHRDSLGSEQVIRPGQLNLMTAGHGVSHAEEATGGYRGVLHGVQLWVAQPGATRDGPPVFEHHAVLPVLELENGAGSVIVGQLGDVTSPARRDSDHVGADLDLHHGTSVVPLDPKAEYALVVVEGAVRVGAREVEPGGLGYLGTGRDELALTVTATARALLIGGIPLDEPLLMWWNFVARTRDEISDAYEDWNAATERFGTVDSRLARIPSDPPLWHRRAHSILEDEPGSATA
ncbi:MAG TPA: pirin family protein [Ilumatobacteraceae bacterium]|nr:pirin family protein [Ilumatobacteraceae bacterium]